MEKQEMKMEDWLFELDKFVEMYWKWVLNNAGKISREQANTKAEKEYRKYQVKTLSPVEKAYLENIKNLQKNILKK
jgi:hypothetical protein